MKIGNTPIVLRLRFSMLSVALAWAAIAACGCSQNNSVADRAQAASDTSNTIQDNLAELSDEDRALAEAQVVCVVNPNNQLGCMGVPYKLAIEGRTVFLCCEHCKDAALKDPQATLAALDGLLQQHSAMLPKSTK